MPLTMIAERIAAAKARCEAATPLYAGVVHNDSNSDDVHQSIVFELARAGKRVALFKGTNHRADADAYAAASIDLPAALADLALYQAFAATVRTVADAVCVRAWGSQVGECGECMQRDLCEAEPLYKALAALGEGEPSSSERRAPLSRVVSVEELEALPSFRDPERADREWGE